MIRSIAIFGLVVVTAASPLSSCFKHNQRVAKNDDGITALAPPGATVQPTKRTEGQTEVPELYTKAGVALDQGDLSLADHYYALAAKAEPNNAQAYIGLGTVAIQRGDSATARSRYRQAITLDPSSASAHVGLGSVAHVEGNEDEAIDEYQTALSLHPNDADSHWGLALAYQSKGDHAQARVHAKRFLDLAPSSPLAPQMRKIAISG